MRRSSRNSSLLGRLEEIFSNSSRTGDWSSSMGIPALHEATSALSVKPSIQVLLSSQWREKLMADPVLRTALQQALGGIASGTQSHNEMLRDWAGVLGGSAMLRLVSGGQLIEVDTSPVGPAEQPSAPPAKDDVGKPPLPDEQTTHARLANELREMTGLGAAKLATALGVSREQYSRWAGGAPISDLRHGQLSYLHTVMADLVRRLGAAEARVWLQTPIDGEITPVELLTSRRWSELHRRVVVLHDAAPVVDGVRVSLLAPIVDRGDNPEDLEAVEGEDAWSPYPPNEKR
ncbi:hypothetical protein [Streptomyces sp. NPDC050738]|uniref:hypothetical protein n=1 Tax=Streptomyces sp. NPDC050738 TaxID=3154744 RepID=UPI00343DC133